MLDLSKLSPAHLNIFDQLKSIGYPEEQAFANAMLWQARAETGIARWNRENPDRPMAMEDWLQRYPLTVTSSIPFGQSRRTLHQFAGPQAQTANASSLSRACAMERSGADREQILQETGWFRGLDNQWRFEIDDSQARFRGYDYGKDEPEVTSTDPEVYQTWMDEAAEAPRGVALPLVLDHPKLFAAYPALQYVRVKVNPRRRDGACMSEDLMMGGFEIEIGDPYSYQVGEALGSVLHEIQHIIQVLEDFARGGAMDDLSLPTGNEIGLAINSEYRRRAAEIEASPEYAALVEAALQALPESEWVHPRTGERDEAWARRRAADRVYESSGLASLEAERLARIDLALNHVGAFGQGMGSRFAGYRHLAGEAEARNTAARANLTEVERLQQAPWATLDIDPRDAVIRMKEHRRAAQADEPLRAGGADWPLIEELAAFQQLPDMRQFEEYERRENLIDRLVELYQSADWFKGVFLPVAHGWIGVTGSAKEAGRWQVTAFDAQMRPMSDSGAQDLPSALREALSEARFDLLAKGVPPSDAPADLTLSRSRVREPGGALLKVYHGTAEVKVIPGDSVPGDPEAIAELKSMAARFGIEDYSAVHPVLERLGRTGQRGRLGDTDADAQRAAELHEKSKWRVEPSRNALGFDAFRMPAGEMELGAHFGTRDQALMFGEPFEFYLDLRNPVRLPDLGNWHYQKVITALRQVGVGISADEEAQVEQARDHNEALRALMLAKGCDGVVYTNEAEGSGDSYIALKSESIFPADQVALPQMRAMNNPAFRSWFGDSVATVDGQPGGVPRVLYHGTDADIDVFFGREVTAWVSEDPALASGYALEQRSGLDEDESAPNVVPVYAAVSNPLTLDVDMNDPAKALRPTLESLGLLGDLRLIYDHADSVWEVVNNSLFMRATKRLGYDGVRVRERGAWTWGIDAPSQLKSIFNAGEFSPESQQILNQSAVSAPAPAFARWFDDSPVVTPQGEPQVMYHGSKTPDGLTVFVPGGRDPAAQSGDMLGVASYFTSDPDEASLYAGEQGAVLPVYLSGRLLNLEAPLLPGAEAERLTAFAERVLLPSDRARFSSLRKVRAFSEAEIEEAKAFFEQERQRWSEVDGVMERSKPEVDKQGDLFLVRYTDFESAVRILTSDDAEALFRSVGWGNLPALGYDGVMLTNSEGRRWVAMHRPEGNVKSAIGNNGQYNRYSPRILDQSAYHGSPAEFDRFDPTVGGGVGRSYGYGIYLTADRGVADRYRQAMARQRGWVGPVAAAIAERFAQEYPQALRVEGYNEQMLAEAGGALLRLVEAYADQAFLAWADELAPAGRVYTAQIPGAEELLSWDLPVSEQAAPIRELIYANSLHTVPLQPGFGMSGEFARDGEPTGADIYLYLEQAYGSAQKASEILSRLGIRGLTYQHLSFGSRDYVVFSPDDARIVRPAEKSAAFRDWFGASVLTESGEAGGLPMVFYHGTRPGVDFEVFQRNAAGDGIYFTPDPLYAEGYTNPLFDSDPERADGAGVAGQIMPVYLRAERPFVVEAEVGSEEWERFVYRGLDCADLEAQGYDAAVLKDAGSGEIDQVIVFQSEQVKSAIGNSGAFDPASPSILNQSAVPGAAREENLRRWFGASKTVDEHGAPRVFYHITPHDFDVFHPGGKAALEGRPEGLSGTAMWFSPNRDYQPAAHNVMTRTGFQSGTNVMPVHLKIERPLLIDSDVMLDWARDVFAGGSSMFPQVVLSHQVEAIKDAGYDGIILEGVGGANERNGDEYIVFDAEQVKSAIGNSGAFDPASPSILNQAPVAEAEGLQLLRDGNPVPATGRPVTYFYAKNLEKAPNMGALYGQDIEPAGDYLVVSSTPIEGGENWEVGTISFANPLVLDAEEGTVAWKKALSAKLGGAKGKALSDAVRALGHDSIITFDKYGLSEAISLGPRRVPAKELQDDLVLVMSPEFDAWFKGSAVADGGRPKKVYHGISHPDSDAPAIEAFDRLHMVKQGRRRAGQDTIGVWFTETLGSRGVEMYSGGGRIDSGVIYPVYLSIKNPWQVSFSGMKRVANRLMGRDRDTKLDGEAVETLRDWMRSNDIDGIQLLHDPRDGDEFAAQQVWIALEPEQIRTAITSDVRYVPASQLQRAPVQAMDAFVDRAISNPAFRSWFAASQATVDGQPGSRPLVLFHGTQADFEAFDPERQGETVSAGDVGFFFTNFAKEASIYATADWWREDPQPNVMPVFLSLQNPKVLTCDPFEGPGIWYDSHGQEEAKKAQEEGYDGLVVRSTQPSMVMPNGEQIAMYVAFEPGQIKSALGNVGAYDRTDSRILFQSAAPAVRVNPIQMEAWTRKAGLSPEAVEAIAKIGIGQRGKPERLMVEAQMVMGGGVLQYAIEHVGDLTDRMSPRHGLEWSYEEVVEKASTCLRKLRSGYGFAREHAENLASNARYRGIPVERHAAEVNEALEHYAAAHAELEAPTRIHALARDAAVLLGRQDFAGAAGKLEALLSAIPTFEAYLGELASADQPRLLNQSAALGRAPRGVLRVDEHGKNIVWEQGSYAIAVDNPQDVGYVSLWHEGKRVGAMSLGRGRTSGTRDYKTVASVEVEKGHRGRGLGKQMYRVALEFVGEQYRGIGGEHEQRSNSRQVPAIYRALGGRELDSGDLIIDRAEPVPGLALEAERRAENFRRWFGDSKVVDADGKPLVVYHGTARTFDAFEASRGNAYYFTDDQAAASVYAANGEEDEYGEEAGPNVVPVYLSLQNPVVLDAAWQQEHMDDGGDWNWEALDNALYEAEEAGHDGAVLRGFMDFAGHEEGDRVERQYDQYIAFRAEQIKSAIGNNGDFSPADPRILAQSAVPAAAPAAVLIEVDELSAQEQEDLVTALLEGRSDSFSRATSGESYSEEYVRQELFGLQDPLMVRRLTLPLEAISAAGRSFSGSVAAAYAGLSSKAPAILVKRDGDGWALVEGGHRYQAALIRGDALIDVVDVTDILQMDWKSYLAGESLPGMPLKSLTDSMPAVQASALVQPGAAARAESFRRWFGGSKIVDAAGAPKVMYHKTYADFTVFDRERVGENDYGYAGAGFYFMPVPLQGFTYGDRTMPVYLSIQNPYVRTASSWNTDPLDPYQWIPANSARFGGDKKAASRAWTAMIREMGYDGFVDATTPDGEVVAFDSAQIKSAVGNNGDFDPSNPSILAQSPVLERSSAPSAFDLQMRAVRAWMGRSVITENGAAGGEPLRVYHGSHVPGITEFEGGKTAYGIFFTPDPLTAGYYAVGDDAQVYEAFLKIERLADFDEPEVFERVMREAIDFTETRDVDDVRAFAARLYREGFGKSEPVTRFFTEQDGFSSVDGVDYTIEDLLRDNRIDSSEIDDLVEEIASEKVTAAYAEAAPPVSEELNAAREAYGSQQFYMEYQDDFMRAARALGYDGVVFADPSSTGASVSYVVFESSQIMLAPDAPAASPVLSSPAAELREWLRESKVTVDGQIGSEPLLLYHASHVPGLVDFDPERQGTNSDDGGNGAGFYFGVSEMAVEMYGEHVGRYYVALSNPYIHHYDGESLTDQLEMDGPAATAYLQAQGYDGVIAKDEGGEIYEVVAFSPDQIRSASAVSLDQAAWHGTPYQFESFELDKVGSSEGAAAYGWGVYFASQREVALWYSGALGLSGSPVPQLFTIRGIPTVRGTPEQKAADLVHGLGLSRAKKLARQWVKEARGAQEEGERGLEYYEGVLAVLEGLTSARDVRRASGNVLKVDIPDVDQLLDWDAPLASQPAAVLRAVERLSAQYDLPSAASGGGWYKALARVAGSDKQASFCLRAEGVPGISYLDGASRGATGGTRNFVIFDDARISILDRESVAVLGQFAGEKAVGADLLALKLARKLARKGKADVDVLAETGWFRGVDGQWRFELDDSQAALRPEMVALLREGDAPMDVARVAAHVGDDGLWSISLVDREGASRFLQRLPAAAVPMILPAGVIDAVRAGGGVAVDLAVGGRLLPALSVEAGFRFAGVESLPLPAVLDYPELFAAYPSLRDSRIALVEGVRSFTSAAGDVLLGRDLSQARLLPVALHEVQHVIQSMEGFAPGGSPEMAFSSPAVNPLATRGGLRAAKAILQAKLEELARPSSLEEYARDAWRVPEGQPIAEDVRTAYAEYVEGFARAAASGALSRSAQEAAAREWYRRLAGEMEARLVERRWRLSAEERRALLPADALDVDPKDAIVLRYSASAACVADSVATASRLGAMIDEYLRVDTGLCAWYKQSVVDSAAWSKGECEKISADLSAWLVERGCDSRVIFAQGLRGGLDAGAASDWEVFRDRGGRSEHFWHAAVLCDGVVVDLSGAQFGSRYAGVRLLSPTDFHAEWESIRVSREGRSVDLRRVEAGSAVAMSVPGAAAGANLGGLALVHGLISRGALPANALREACVVLAAEGRVTEADDLRMVSPAALEAFGWARRRKTGGQIVSMDTLLADCDGVFDHLAQELADWNPARYGLAAARGGMTVTDLVRGMLVRLQEGEGVDRDVALGLVLEAFDEAGVLAVEVQQGIHRVRVDLDFAAESFQQALLVAEHAPRAQIAIGQNLAFDIRLLTMADASSFAHETGHAFLEILRDQARMTTAKDSQIRADWEAVSDWLGLRGLHPAASIPEEAHERFARGFELYLRKGVAPSSELEGVFKVLADLLLKIYETLRSLFVRLPADVEEVFDRMLADQEAMAETGVDRAVPVDRNEIEIK